MVVLKSGYYGNIEIKPRWPAKEVKVEPVVLQVLCDIQLMLPETMSLVLTRGYEKRSNHLGMARNVFLLLFVST